MSTMAWWEARRYRYNKGLVIAGVLAFIAFEIVGEYVVWPRDHEFEITIFTMAFQGAGYLCAMLLANVLYFLGPLADSLLNVNDTDEFRELLYSLGYWFSFALPFWVPVMLFFTTINDPILPNPAR